MSYFFNVTAYTDDNAEASLATEQQILNSYRKGGFELLPARYHHLRNYLAMLPFKSGVRLYSAQDAARTTEKLARHTAFSVVSEQLKARSGETELDTAIAQQKAGLHSPAEQAIHLSIPLLESNNLTFTRPQLLSTAMEFDGEVRSRWRILTGPFRRRLRPAVC